MAKAKKKTTAKKAPAKKVTAKKAPAKKAAPKKVAAKKAPAKKAAPKKVAAKKAPVKKAAPKKVAAKKAPAKKAETKTKDKKPKVLSREEAILKYKNSISAKSTIVEYDDEDGEFEIEVDIIEDDLETVDEAMGDEEVYDEEDEEKSFDNQEDNFDEEDEEREVGEGSYSYGWGYNDAFDKPEDDDVDHELDEDEKYAMGDRTEDEEGMDDDDY